MSDLRRGKNTRHLLTGLLRQSVFGRLAGYEDVNDAERLSRDPAMRAIVDRKGLDCDSVVLCTARRANDGLYRELESRHSEWPDAELQAVYRVGDCLAPRMLPDAVFDGHRLAREFDGPTPEHSRPYIRERQIWGREAMPALQTAAS